MARIKARTAPLKRVRLTWKSGIENLVLRTVKEETVIVYPFTVTHLRLVAAIRSRLKSRLLIVHAYTDPEANTITVYAEPWGTRFQRASAAFKVGLKRAMVERGVAKKRQKVHA